MKIKYPHPKGHRYKKGSIKLPGHPRVDIYYGLESCDDLYYCEDKNLWFPMGEFNSRNYLSASSCNCKIHSVKSACRHIRKHNEIPIGSRFRLISNFIGMDIYLKKEKSR